MYSFWNTFFFLACNKSGEKSPSGRTARNSFPLRPHAVMRQITEKKALIHYKESHNPQKMCLPPLWALDWNLLWTPCTPPPTWPLDFWVQRPSQPSPCHPSLTQQAHVGLAGVPPSAPVLWRGHQHGLRRPGAIQVGSAVRERDAVIGAVDDQRVVVITGVFELLENQTDACRGKFTHIIPQCCTRVASLCPLCVSLLCLLYLGPAGWPWCTVQPSQRVLRACPAQKEEPEVEGEARLMCVRSSAIWFVDQRFAFAFV